MSRSHAKPACLEIRSADCGSVIAQSVAERVPGIGGIERLRAARKDFYLHVCTDRQPLVRSIVFQPCYWVAEGVQVFARKAWLRIQVQGMRETALIGEFTRLQMQQVM